MNWCSCGNGRMDEAAADKPIQALSATHSNIHKLLHDIYRMAQPWSPGTRITVDLKKQRGNSAKALLFYVTHLRVYLCVSFYSLYKTDSAEKMMALDSPFLF